MQCACCQVTAAECKYFCCGVMVTGSIQHAGYSTSMLVAACLLILQAYYWGRPVWTGQSVTDAMLRYCISLCFCCITRTKSLFCVNSIFIAIYAVPSLHAYTAWTFCFARAWNTARWRTLYAAWHMTQRHQAPLDLRKHKTDGIRKQRGVSSIEKAEGRGHFRAKGKIRSVGLCIRSNK